MASSTVTILDALPESTHRRLMTPELDAQLRELGNVLVCRDARNLSEKEYGSLWAQADVVLSGWGIRPPTPAMLNNAGHLKAICHTAGSIKMFPRYALEKGVVITSARAGMARTVAEFCLMNTLILLRRLLYYVDAAPERKAFFAPDGARPVNQTLYDKTVGLIGYGHIARHFRALLAPFHCTVLTYDPYLSEEIAAREQVQKVDLPFLLQNAPIVSLHTPEIPATRGMIGKRELAMLRDGAIFLNSARGRLVDTDALTAELKTGRIFAAIDVTEPEPLPADHPLRFLPNVLFTPHIAGPTEDELHSLTRMALTDMARILQGEPPLHSISLDAYDLMSF